MDFMRILHLHNYYPAAEVNQAAATALECMAMMTNIYFSPNIKYASDKHRVMLTPHKKTPANFLLGALMATQSTPLVARSKCPT
jgi:hypothetical protein